MMRSKKKKSLVLLDDDTLYETIIREMPIEKPLMPVNCNDLLDEYQHMASNSFDVIGAAADYFAERNRTIELRKRIAAEESVLNTRNMEAERQSNIKLREYAKQLQVQVGIWKKDLEITLKKSRMTAQRIVSITEKRKGVLQTDRLIRSLIVIDRGQISELKEILRNFDKMGIDGHEEHYMKINEEVVKRTRHVDKLIKQLIA